MKEAWSTPKIIKIELKKDILMTSCLTDDSTAPCNPTCECDGRALCYPH